MLLGFFISICMGRGIEISAIKMYENESEQPSLNHTTFSKHYVFQSNSTIVRASHVIQNKAFNKMGLIISSFQNKSFYNKTQKHGNIGTMQINYSSDKPNKFNNVKKVLEQKHKGICNSKTTRRVFGKNYSFSQKPTKDHKLLYTRPVSYTHLDVYKRQSFHHCTVWYSEFEYISYISIYKLRMPQHRLINL